MEFRPGGSQEEIPRSLKGERLKRDPDPTDDKNLDDLIQLVTDARIKTRMEMEYGDYLGIHCEQLSQRDMRDFVVEDCGKV